jgi:hypothetical protein
MWKELLLTYFNVQSRRYFPQGGLECSTHVSEVSSLILCIRHLSLRSVMAHLTANPNTDITLYSEIIPFVGTTSLHIYHTDVRVMHRIKTGIILHRY